MGYLCLIMTPIVDRKWIVKEPGNPVLVRQLAQELGIDHVLSELLVQRGIKNYEQAREFFRPDLSMLHDPFLMVDMQKAVDRIELAVNRKEKILIYELRKAHEEAVAFEKQAALDRHKYISVATKIIEQLNSASQRGEISLDRAWTYRIPRFLDMFKKIPRRTKADTVLFDDETRETLTVIQSEKIGIDTLLKESWGTIWKN